eukprot:70862-Rhodomonas_salina.1
MTGFAASRHALSGAGGSLPADVGALASQLQARGQLESEGPGPGGAARASARSTGSGRGHHARAALQGDWDSFGSEHVISL